MVKSKGLSGKIPQREFPKLMASKASTAVFMVTKFSLAFNEFEGTVVHGLAANGKGIGSHSDKWRGYNQLYDYEGAVMLSND